MNPEENIKIVQKAYQDFSKGDVEAILAALDPNVEWKTPESEGIPMTGTLKGPAQVARFFSSVAQTWNFEQFLPQDFIASGDSVAVRGTYRAKSLLTGRVADADWVMVWRIRGGKVTNFQEYTDTAVLRDALTAHAAAV